MTDINDKQTLDFIKESAFGFRKLKLFLLNGKVIIGEKLSGMEREILNLWKEYYGR